jgi:hemerythrin-like metal-binding protein
MSVTDGWNPSLVTGYKDIDDQHRAVFAAFDALLDALRHGYGDHEVKRTLQHLETYIGEHFLHEETLMKQKGYPELTAHVAAHEAFSTRMDDLRKVLQKTGTSKALAVQTLQAIGSLLAQDIETHDRKLAGFLNPKGKAT